MMGLLDFLKKRTPLQREVPPIPDAQTIYFKNGKMYKVYPTDKESWYDARYLVSDGKLYVLENVKDIQRIPIPDFDKKDTMLEGYGVTGSLDYVMRMKAGAYYNRNEKQLCSACLWKATDLMFARGMWQPKDFDRIINWHNELGMFDEAKKAEHYLKQHKEYNETPGDAFDRMAKTISDSVLEKQKEFENDLVAFHNYSGSCCPQCASHSGRVYSISGKSKTFPPMPKYVIKHSNFHPGCRCIMAPFWESDTSIYFRGERVNAIQASNRPWVDDRTPEEIEQYLTSIQTVNKREVQRIRQRNFSLQKGKNRVEFEQIQKMFPDKAPKSLTGYTRMKNSQSKNFLKLVALAEQKGISIRIEKKNVESPRCFSTENMKGAKIVEPK